MTVVIRIRFNATDRHAHTHTHSSHLISHTEEQKDGMEFGKTQKLWLLAATCYHLLVIAMKQQDLSEQPEEQSTTLK